jgi:hypothetical protein
VPLSSLSIHSRRLAHHLPVRPFFGFDIMISYSAWLSERLWLKTKTYQIRWLFAIEDPGRPLTQGDNIK